MSAEKWLDEAREFRRTGWYAKALARLDGCEGWPSPFDALGIAMRAKVLLLRDPFQARGLLERHAARFTSEQTRLEYYLTLGQACANARAFDAARDAFAAAEPYAKSVNAQAHLAHQRGRLRYLEGSYDPEDPDVARAIGGGDVHVRMLTLVIRAWMHAGVGDYEAQIVDLRAMLELARRHPAQTDLYTIGRTLHSLLRIASELADEEAAADARAFYATVAWTPELADARFLCVRALAWSAFLFGNAEWKRLMRDARVLSPNDAWRVMAHADRAYVARMEGDEAVALDELAAAGECARRVDWSRTVDEEMQALVTFAALLASSDRVRAQGLMSIYLRGTERVDPSLAVAHDPRVHAFSQYAFARVHEVLGNDEAAAAAYEAAYALFAGARHHFRAALAALGLIHLTGRQPWKARAREHASHFASSAFYPYIEGQIARVKA